MFLIILGSFLLQKSASNVVNTMFLAILLNYQSGYFFSTIKIKSTCSYIPLMLLQLASSPFVRSIQWYAFS